MPFPLEDGRAVRIDDARGPRRERDARKRVLTFGGVAASDMHGGNILYVYKFIVLVILIDCTPICKQRLPAPSGIDPPLGNGMHGILQKVRGRENCGP